MTSGYATAELPPQFIFYLDQDDPAVSIVAEWIEQHGGVAHVGPRCLLSAAWNELVQYAKHDVLMHCGDDIIFRSDSWDECVLAAFDTIPDKIALVHGRDGYQDENLATHGFYHRRWVETLGYLVPPYFSSDYNDTWNTEIADALGRRHYLPHVYTEHMHPVIGKAELDQTHLERMARGDRDNVQQLYHDLAPRRAIDVAKLRNAIAEWVPSE